jgi:hypothetical protein
VFFGFCIGEVIAEFLVNRSPAWKTTLNRLLQLPTCDDHPHFIHLSFHPIGECDNKLSEMALMLTIARRSAQCKDSLDKGVTNLVINPQLMSSIHCINENDARAICVCCVDIIANDNCGSCFCSLVWPF